MGEVEVSLQLFADGFVSGEFPSVVTGDGMHPAAMGFEQAGHGIADRLRGLALHLTDQHVTGLALDQADNGLFVAAADDGIGLPVTDPAAIIHDGRALFDGLAVGNDAPAVYLAIAFLALLLAAQIAP